MLRLLSGRTHQVITGVCLATGRERQRAAEVPSSAFSPSPMRDRRLRSHRRAAGQSRRLRHPGPRRPLGPAHRRLLLQRGWPAPRASQQHDRGHAGSPKLSRALATPQTTRSREHPRHRSTFLSSLRVSAIAWHNKDEQQHRLNVINTDQPPRALASLPSNRRSAIIAASSAVRGDERIDADGFILRMCRLTYRAHAVQRRYSQRRSEVPIRPTSGRCFFQRKPQPRRQFLRLSKSAAVPSVRSIGGRFNPPVSRNPAVRIARLQRLAAFGHRLRIRDCLHPQIDLRPSPPPPPHSTGRRPPPRPHSASCRVPDPSSR